MKLAFHSFYALTNSLSTGNISQLSGMLFNSSFCFEWCLLAFIQQFLIALCCPCDKHSSLRKIVDVKKTEIYVHFFVDQAWLVRKTDYSWYALIISNFFVPNSMILSFCTCSLKWVLKTADIYLIVCLSSGEFTFKNQVVLACSVTKIECWDLLSLIGLLPYLV